MYFSTSTTSYILEQSLKDKENEASKTFLIGIFGGISIGITIVVIPMLFCLIWSRRKRGLGTKPREPEDPRSHCAVGRTNEDRKTPCLADSRESVSGAMRGRRVTEKKIGYRLKKKIKRTSRWFVTKTVPNWLVTRTDDAKLKNRLEKVDSMKYNRNRYLSTSTVGEITTYLDLDAGEDFYNPATSRENQAETLNRSHTNRISELGHRGSVSTLMQADSTRRLSVASLDVADNNEGSRPDTWLERKGNISRADELVSKTRDRRTSGNTGHGKKGERRCSCSPNVDFAVASEKGRIFTVHAQVLARPTSRTRAQTIGEARGARYQDNMECIVESWDKFATSSPLARKRRADTEPNKTRMANLSVNQKHVIQNFDQALKQKTDFASVSKEPTNKFSQENVSQIKRTVDDSVMRYCSYNVQGFALPDQMCDSDTAARMQKKTQSSVEGLVKSNVTGQQSPRGTTPSNQMESTRILKHNSVRALQQGPSMPYKQYNSFPRAAKRRRKVNNLFSNNSLDNSHHTELSDSLPPDWTRERSGTERLENLCQNLEKLSMSIGASSSSGIDTLT
eukprot:Seg670.5 transcript_id=Seg670.5/GoldUCD/mRNA.D3Y31 product="hypothetical protein" protein_id=Seg670.5/GoldUCD/D3Y31